MKKIIFSILTLLLIALYFSMNLQAQSSEQDLDQAELMKQFVGKWTAETGVDSTVLWEVIPFEKGYETNVSWQADGETYQTGKGIIGFTWENREVNMYFLWSDGMLSRDMGKFVSAKKIMWERFTANHEQVLASMEMNLLTLDKFKYIFKWRGMEQTWDNAEVTEWIWTRVKK
jgi:hypothetical protein